jgi:antirestriction protein ArdC
MAEKKPDKAYPSQFDKVKEITDKLEAGIQALFESEAFKNYLKTLSKFHDYSLNNTILIAMQKPDATLVAGYTAWQKNFGRQVQKGETGIRILAPTPYKKQMEVDRLDPVTGQAVLNPDGSTAKDLKEIMVPAFKVVNVFDVSQTDGKPLPTIGVDELEGNVTNYELFFEALKRACPVPVDFEQISSGAKGYYHTVEQRIALQEGMSEVQTVKTMIHEMAHQKLHSIDPKDLPPEEPRLTRNAKEVEAEAIAYTVSQHYGIETSDYSFAYIAGWSKDRSAPELKASLGLIRNASSEMISLIEEKLLEVQKEREQATEKAIREQIPEREYGPEHRALREELIREGADVRELWLGGKPVDLTAMDLSAAEVADLRYRMEVEAIPRMRFSKEQWDQIQAGIRE